MLTRARKRTLEQELSEELHSIAETHQQGDWLGDFHLQGLAKDVFELTVDIGPPNAPRSHSRSLSPSDTPRTTSNNDFNGQASDGASACHGGGNLTAQNFLSEMEKLSNDLTPWEYNRAIYHFTGRFKLPLFFSMNPQQRINYLKTFTPSLPPSVP